MKATEWFIQNRNNALPTKETKLSSHVEVVLSDLVKSFPFCMRSCLACGGTTK